LIDGLSEDGVTVGRNVNIGPYCQIEATGVITSIGKGVMIGDNSGMGAFCFVGAAGGVRIGNNVIMGQRVSFHSEDHRFDRIDVPIRMQGVTRKGIEIGDDCWIGAGVVFLDGACVGNGCVIGAGAVVKGVIPQNSIAVGVPARVIRKRTVQL
jgi:acetyltransferase-like isoleucine patch superfamily enzyme